MKNNQVLVETSEASRSWCR